MPFGFVLRGSLTNVNTGRTIRAMSKPEFGDLIRHARQRKGLSLRQLALEVEIDYSRLARIEQGTRPAPDLAAVRRLADVLELDMAALVVAAGTSREVVENLLWAERLHNGRLQGPQSTLAPTQFALAVKNVFHGDVLTREGALCTVRLGSDTVRVLSFSSRDELTFHVPPEAVVVHRAMPDPSGSTVGNVLDVRVKKIRTLGQATHLVLRGSGFELGSLHERQTIERLGLRLGDRVYASFQVTAISAGKE